MNRKRTRYAVWVALALVVVRQNLETSSADVVQARGRAVRLEWRPEQTYVIDGTGETEEADE